MVSAVGSRRRLPRLFFIAFVTFGPQLISLIFIVADIDEASPIWLRVAPIPLSKFLDSQLVDWVTQRDAGLVSRDLDSRMYLSD